MDVKTLRKQSGKDLDKSLSDAQVRLRELRFSLASNQLKDVRQVRKVRKEIARIKTVLAQRKAVSGEAGPQAKPDQALPGGLPGKK